MVLDPESIEDGVVLVDGPPEEIVEAILIHTFSRGGTVETTQASALEREILDVDDIAPVWENCDKTVDHRLQTIIVRQEVCDDDGLFPLVMPDGLRNGRQVSDAFSFNDTRLLELTPGELPQREFEPVHGLLPPFLGKDVVHVGGQMGRDIIKMLGGGHLGGCLA